MPSRATTGRCLCGAVTFTVDGPLGPAVVCHCTDCRRCTGSAFNVGVRVERAVFRITSGAPKGFTSHGDSGRELTRHFCADCGSPLFTSAPKHPAHYFVKAGAFDDPAVVRPVRQDWMRSAVDWRAVAPDLPAFDRGPDD